MAIGLKPELVTKIRLQVLHEVVDEIVKAFSVDYPFSVADSIKKGVLENQFFSDIHIYFLDSGRKKVAEAKLSIDWTEHAVSASSSEGRTFHLNPNQSINQQISEVFPVIMEHVQKVKKTLNVVGTEVWYTWRDEIALDSNKLFEARTKLGFSTDTKNRATPPVWSENVKNIVNLNFSSAELSELGISIIHKK